MRAVEATGEEYDRLWRMMSRRHPVYLKYHPVYLKYKEKTRRRLPVVVLEPLDALPA